MTKPINLTVLPDAQTSKSGLTLNALLSYLQFYLAPNEDGVKPKIGFDAWIKYFEDNGLDISREYRYITAPITINLIAGEYNITTMVRVFTIADFSIIGDKDRTVIKFHKYDFVNEPFIWYSVFKKGRNCVAFISSYMKDPKEPDIKPEPAKIENCLTLKNLVIRMEDGLWFPYKITNSQGNKEEVSLGGLLYYANFLEAEISGLDMEADGNGEVTLLDGEECDHQRITGCRFYLNNWNDRTTDDWVLQAEQGANLNIRGGNKSVLVADNIFIKHGSDEALTFFSTAEAGKSIVSVHENITVVRNTFTYLDSESSIKDPSVPVVTDNHSNSHSNHSKISESSPTKEKTESTDPDKEHDDRPVHINGVLITFNATDNVKSIWRNVLFADNTIRLEGPVRRAVSMTVIPGDVWQNVEFAGNHLYHTYIQNHVAPGNGAGEYWYSYSFIFQKSPDASLLAPATRSSGIAEETEEVSTPVVYRGNVIHYAQHTHDRPMGNKTPLAYEHSCFAVTGADVDIIDNIIDGTEAVVSRLPNADGIYGNTDNPVSLFHCLKCEAATVVGKRYNVNINGNFADGYGVVLKCRPQFDNSKVVSNYNIRMENNTLSDGAAMVLYNTRDSNIEVVRNSFTGCSKETFIQAVYKVKLQADPAVKLSLFQNKIAPGFGLGSYCNIIAADVPKDSPVLTPISEFCFMLNYLPGYAGMSMPEKNTAAQSHISDNLFESKPSNVCGS